MAGLEFVEDPVTFTSRSIVSWLVEQLYNARYLLLLVTMNSQCWPTVLTEVFCDIIRNPLSANKDENLSILSTDDIKMLDQLGTLLKIAADFNDLGNVMICCELH